MIKEERIDQILEGLRNDKENLSEEIKLFASNQPGLLALLFSDDYLFLTEAEREYLLFLLLVIWKSVKEYNPDLTQINPSDIALLEEKNWELLNLQKAGNFRDRLNVFFDNYEEEDLLAFIEDSISIEEEDMITKAGREPLFIVLKTAIDALTRD